MLVHDLLARAAGTTPDATLAIEPRARCTYADVAARAARLARFLAGSGVRRGDRVVLALDNSIEWIAAYFGILGAGAVAVPLARGTRNDRLAHALRDCTPAACIMDPAGATTAAPALLVSAVRTVGVTGPAEPVREVWSGSSPPALVELAPALAAQPDTMPGVRQIDLDLAAIIYTSGSTGVPRGVMLSHLNICANTASIVEYLRLTSRDRVMVVLPFFYVYGLSLLHTHVGVGGSLVLENRFAFPNVVLRALQDHEVTGLSGVPSTFAFLLHRSSLRSMRFPSLRYTTQAGGAMAPALIREWRSVLPDVPFYVMYGATEASARLSYLDPADLDRRIGSIGRAIPNVELRLLGDDGRPVAPGAVGEIVARGSNVSSGYWAAPGETGERFGPDGFRTGDLAVADEDGFLYLVGRKHDMLKVGAHRVAAREIEDVLHEHDDVHEAAVVPAPDPLLGEVPVAFVSSRNGHIDRAAVLAFCRSRLAEHKVPARLIVEDDLPKTGAGKIDKRALQDRLGPSAAV